MLSKSNESLTNKPITISIGIHSVLIVLFLLLFYFDKPVEENNLTYTGGIDNENRTGDLIEPDSQ